MATGVDDSCHLPDDLRDLFGATASSSLDGVWSYDARTEDLSITLVGDDNPVRIVQQQLWSARLSRTERRSLGRSYAALRKGLAKKLSWECQIDTSDGVAWLLACGKIAARDEVGHPRRLIGTFLDITQRKKEEARIAHMALHDPLTALPNRTLFESRLKQEISLAERKSTTFAVLACDLDRFKIVNDTLGHQAGDALLKVVAQRMREVIREGDTLARLGGDEFAVILHDLADPFEAGLIADRLISVISQPIRLAGKDVSVGASIGIAVVSRSGDQSFSGASQVVEQADLALYASKASGRNCFTFFDADMTRRIQAKTRMADDLSHAIKRGELALYLQPIVHARTGEVCSYEALMRWQHRAHEGMSPSVFIPLAEETGIMDDLGDWAISEACRLAATWIEQSSISVNVSAVQFRHPERLRLSVSSSLAKSGLQPHRLELEINETVLDQNYGDVLVCLGDLRGLGVRIVLDDFGTGRSSLSHLRSFPFDTIKIDRVLITDLPCSESGAIVQAIVDLATSFGADVVAEGVETSDQLDWLREAGCSRIQGFLSGVPASNTGKAPNSLTADFRVGPKKLTEVVKERRNEADPGGRRTIRDLHQSRKPAFGAAQIIVA